MSELNPPKDDSITNIDDNMIIVVIDEDNCMKSSTLHSSQISCSPASDKDRIDKLIAKRDILLAAIDSDIDSSSKDSIDTLKDIPSTIDIPTNITTKPLFSLPNDGSFTVIYNKFKTTQMMMWMMWTILPFNRTLESRMTTQI